MIKFFRKIRQRLLNENRFTKYLLYALGEIVLVVIGILIALQINNWKEMKKERTQEQAILSQVHTEFKSNLKQLDEKIDIRKRQISRAQDLLAFIDYPESRVKDSIETALPHTIGYSTFDPIVNDLASAGSLRIIRNDSLKLLLSQWTSELVQVVESEQSWYKYRNEEYVPFLIKHTQLRSMRNAAMKSTFVGKFLIDVDNQEAMDSRVDSIGNSAFNYDIDVLLNNPDFEDHLTRCIVTNSVANVQSYILRERMLLILKILESELDSKN